MISLLDSYVAELEFELVIKNEIRKLLGNPKFKIITLELAQYFLESLQTYNCNIHHTVSFCSFDVYFSHFCSLRVQPFILSFTPHFP